MANIVGKQFMFMALVFLLVLVVSTAHARQIAADTHYTNFAKLKSQQKEEVFSTSKDRPFDAKHFARTEEQRNFYTQSEENQPFGLFGQQSETPPSIPAPVVPDPNTKPKYTTVQEQYQNAQYETNNEGPSDSAEEATTEEEEENFYQDKPTVDTNWQQQAKTNRLYDSYLDAAATRKEADVARTYSNSYTPQSTTAQQQYYHDSYTNNAQAEANKFYVPNQESAAATKEEEFAANTYSHSYIPQSTAQQQNYQNNGDTVEAKKEEDFAQTYSNSFNPFNQKPDKSTTAQQYYQNNYNRKFEAVAAANNYPNTFNPFNQQQKKPTESTSAQLHYQNNYQTNGDTVVAKEEEDVTNNPFASKFEAYAAAAAANNYQNNDLLLSPPPPSPPAPVYDNVFGSDKELNDFLNNAQQTYTNTNNKANAAQQYYNRFQAQDEKNNQEKFLTNTDLDAFLAQQDKFDSEADDEEEEKETTNTDTPSYQDMSNTKYNNNKYAFNTRTNQYVNQDLFNPQGYPFSSQNSVHKQGQFQSQTNTKGFLNYDNDP